MTVSARADMDLSVRGLAAGGVRASFELTARGPLLGLAGQFALLAVLAASVGVGIAGWLVGSTYAVVTWATLTHGMQRCGMRTLGPANAVTLARATLVGGVAALVADSLAGRTVVPVLIGLAAVALLLDAVDGQVARRTRTVSGLGARFDMETDAFLILVLSLFVAQSLGGWVLVIGFMRYAFVAAAWALPWMQAPLPMSFSRKVVAALQGIVLAVAGAGVLPGLVSFLAVAAALMLLGWSFGRDVEWLWRSRSRAGEVQPAPVRRAAVTTARPQHERRSPGRGARSAGSTVAPVRPHAGPPERSSARFARAGRRIRRPRSVGSRRTSAAACALEP